MSEQQAAKLLEQVARLNAQVAEIAALLAGELPKVCEKVAKIEASTRYSAGSLQRICADGLPMQVAS